MTSQRSSSGFYYDSLQLSVSFQDISHARKDTKNIINNQNEIFKKDTHFEKKCKFVQKKEARGFRLIELFKRVQFPITNI